MYTTAEIMDEITGTTCCRAAIAHAAAEVSAHDDELKELSNFAGMFNRMPTIKAYAVIRRAPVRYGLDVVVVGFYTSRNVAELVVDHCKHDEGYDDDRWYDWYGKPEFDIAPVEVNAYPNGQLGFSYYE